MDTEGPKLSEDTENVEDALFGMEGLRPSLLPTPWGPESEALGSESQSESDLSHRSLFRKPVRNSFDNSIVPRSSDDGVPVAPSEFSKMQDGVSPSPKPEGQSENLIEDRVTLVFGPLHQSEAATEHANRHRDLLPLPANSGLRVSFLRGAFLECTLCDCPLWP